MTDEEKAATAAENENRAENSAASAESAAADNGGNFGDADNFGGDVEPAADFEDNFGLGDQMQSMGRIPTAPSSVKKKEPASPVTPRQEPSEPMPPEPEPGLSAAGNFDDDAAEPEADPNSLSVSGNFDDEVSGMEDSGDLTVSGEDSGDITISVNGSQEDGNVVQPKQKKTREEDLFDRFQLVHMPADLCRYAGWFHLYMGEHPDALEKLEPLLCDEASVEAVRLGLKRLAVFPPPEFQPSVFLFPYGMMTEEERNDLRAHMKNYPEYAKLAKGEYPYFDPPQFYYRHGAIYLDPAVTARLEGGVFYQCGAYCGASLIAMSQYKPSMMYGFEPSTGNSVYLASNVARAKIENVEMYKVCIGDRPGKATVPDRDKEGKPCKTEVPITTLDIFEQRKEVKGRVAWIQADVGGMSLPVVKGAEQMIKRDKPLITVAIYHNPEEFFEIVPLLHEWVPEYKFMVRRCQCSPKTIYDKITLIAYVP